MTMSDDLLLFDRMVQESAKIDIKDTGHAKYGDVILKEPQSPSSIVNIRGVPLNALVIQVDRFKSPDSILSKTNGQCKRGDYIIIANKNSTKIILYIEMKTTKCKENKIIDQLKGAVCFVGYCKVIAKEFWDNPDFLSGYESRFVSFTHTGSIQKRTTKVYRKNQINNTPDRLMKISFTNEEHFNHLV